MKDPSRMTQLRRALCLSLLAIAICPYAGAQSRRDPTPAEKLVLMKPFDALNAAILPFLKAHDLELDPSSADFNETQSVPIKRVIGGAFEWKCTLKQNSDRFHFVHPPQTPFVENMVITISGAEDLIKALLDKTDWIKIANSLTR